MENVMYQIFLDGKVVTEKITQKEVRSRKKEYEDKGEVIVVAFVEDWNAVEDVHQQLMTNAYTNFKNVGFLESLDETERYAVALGNLNYQVHNGGWAQWIMNGYCVAFPHVIEALNAVGTEKAMKVKAMVESMEDILLDDVVDGTSTETGCMGTYLKDDATSEECPECMGDGYCEDGEDCNYCGGSGEIENEVDYASSSDYWKLADDGFLEECEQFFKNRVTKKG